MHRCPAIDLVRPGAGYWKQAEETRKAIADGWMHTGDVCTIDERGYCRVVGRSKDMVGRCRMRHPAGANDAIL